MDVSPRSSSCSPDPESSLKIYRRVFDLCDQDGNGFITKPELSHICEQYSDGVGDAEADSLLDNVIQCLDANHDGHISFEEFKAGFESFQRLSEDSLTPSTLSNSTPCKTIPEEVYESDPVPNMEEGAWREVLEKVDPQGTLEVTGVGAVWKELYRRDPGLLENFESFLTDVVSELEQTESEKETLQNHVRRMQKQHTREVSEMDDLLQEELQLAKVNHQQTNASQTSRLSNHYSSLLADREAVINELSTNENDLKKELHHKVMSESNLKQEKKFLLSANQVLQDQLDNPSSDSGSQNSQSGGPRSRGTSEQGEEEEEEEEDKLYEQEELHPHSGMEQGHDVSHDTSLYIHEARDRGHEEIKYYPPKKSPRPNVGGSGDGGGDGGDDSRHAVQTDEAISQHQPIVDHPQQQGVESPHPQGVGSLHSLAPHAVRSSSHSSQGVGSSGGPTVLGGVSREYGLGADVNNTSLTLSHDDVMPRRDHMPRPPSPRAISRVFKVIFLGDSGVGKSSLISFLTEGEFRSDVISTVGLDFSTKTLRVGEERIVFQLWDTAGQERFNNALTPVYFRRADAFVIVYDVSDVKTFKATKKWISVIKAALRELPPVLMLVGNKCDKVGQRCVANEDGMRLALELKCLFSETSALSGDNVLQAHSTLAQLLLARENADLQEIRKRAVSNVTQKSNCFC